VVILFFTTEAQRALRFLSLCSSCLCGFNIYHGGTEGTEFFSLRSPDKSGSSICAFAVNNFSPRRRRVRRVLFLCVLCVFVVLIFTTEAQRALRFFSLCSSCLCGFNIYHGGTEGTEFLSLCSLCLCGLIFTTEAQRALRFILLLQILSSAEDRYFLY